MFLDFRGCSWIFKDFLRLSWFLIDFLRFFGFSWIFWDFLWFVCNFVEFHRFSWMFVVFYWIFMIFCGFMNVHGFSETFLEFHRFCLIFISFLRCVLCIFLSFHVFSWVFLVCRATGLSRHLWQRLATSWQRADDEQSWYSEQLRKRTSKNPFAASLCLGHIYVSGRNRCVWFCIRKGVIYGGCKIQWEFVGFRWIS